MSFRFTDHDFISYSFNEIQIIIVCISPLTKVRHRIEMESVKAFSVGKAGKLRK
jgi:hypothetical protein